MFQLGRRCRPPSAPPWKESFRGWKWNWPIGTAKKELGRFGADLSVSGDLGGGLDGLQKLRWIYDQIDIMEKRQDLSVWIPKSADKQPWLVNWVELNIDETLRFHRLPRALSKHLKS